MTACYYFLYHHCVLLFLVLFLVLLRANLRSYSELPPDPTGKKNKKIRRAEAANRGEDVMDLQVREEAEAGGGGVSTGGRDRKRTKTAEARKILEVCISSQIDDNHNTYIHTYIHRSIHTYVHTYIHT